MLPFHCYHCKEATAVFSPLGLGWSLKWISAELKVVHETWEHFVLQWACLGCGADYSGAAKSRATPSHKSWCAGLTASHVTPPTCPDSYNRHRYRCLSPFCHDALQGCINRWHVRADCNLHAPVILLWCTLILWDELKKHKSSLKSCCLKRWWCKCDNRRM